MLRCQPIRAVGVYIEVSQQTRPFQWSIQIIYVIYKLWLFWWKKVSAPQETYNCLKKAFHEPFEKWDWYKKNLS